MLRVYAPIRTLLLLTKNLGLMRVLQMSVLSEPEKVSDLHTYVRIFGSATSKADLRKRARYPAATGHQQGSGDEGGPSEVGRRSHLREEPLLSRPHARERGLRATMAESPAVPQSRERGPRATMTESSSGAEPTSRDKRAANALDTLEQKKVRAFEELTTLLDEYSIQELLAGQAPTAFDEHLLQLKRQLEFGEYVKKRAESRDVADVERLTTFGGRTLKQALEEVRKLEREREEAVRSRSKVPATVSDAGTERFPNLDLDVGAPTSVTPSPPYTAAGFADNPPRRRRAVPTELLGWSFAAEQDAALVRDEEEQEASTPSSSIRGAPVRQPRDDNGRAEGRPKAQQQQPSQPKRAEPSRSLQTPTNEPAYPLFVPEAYLNTPRAQRFNESRQNVVLRARQSSSSHAHPPLERKPSFFRSETETSSTSAEGAERRLLQINDRSLSSPTDPPMPKTSGGFSTSIRNKFMPRKTSEAYDSQRAVSRTNTFPSRPSTGTEGGEAFGERLGGAEADQRDPESSGKTLKKLRSKRSLARLFRSQSPEPPMPTMPPEYRGS